jgi:hypothetical protein
MGRCPVSAPQGVPELGLLFSSATITPTRTHKAYTPKGKGKRIFPCQEVHSRPGALYNVPPSPSVGATFLSKYLVFNLRSTTTIECPNTPPYFSILISFLPYRYLFNADQRAQPIISSNGPGEYINYLRQILWNCHATRGGGEGAAREGREVESLELFKPNSVLLDF